MTNRVLLFLKLFFLIMFTTGCSSYSLDDFRDEGDSITKALITEFQHIRTKDELIDHSIRLRQLFDDLVDVMIRAAEFRKEHPHAFLSLRESTLSDQLRTEMNRILSIEGTREFMEKIQETALSRLESYDNINSQSLAF